MKLLINHKEEQFDEKELTLHKLLEIKDLKFKRLLIRVNGKVVSENDISETKLKEGDQLDIVRIISGG